jgi:2-polyprenyl-6-methoxyphenol hydroxylase-like FAD-dependent oxidoreductase
VPVEEFLAGFPDGDTPFRWRMADVRAPHWVRGRVALVGDAAAAFLPTAGIGASMALESAAVLADELSRTDGHYLPNALELYERRRRRRVQAAQNQSRRLARMMFVRSSALARVRNRALSFTRMEQLIGPLIADLRRPI